MTTESVSSDPNQKNNGSVSYSLDAVGNRLSAASSLQGVSSSSSTFNADDRQSTEVYDTNGNVLSIVGKKLVAAMFLLFIFTIGLSVAVPAVSRQIQLDRELETIERGKQYQRAIQLYYRRFHAFPSTVDALIDTNDVRYLRKRYVDPMTRKDDWRPILFGQNKAPTAMGFFGQPLTGMGSTGGAPLWQASGRAEEHGWAPPQQSARVPCSPAETDRRLAAASLCPQPLRALPAPRPAQLLTRIQLQARDRIPMPRPLAAQASSEYLRRVAAVRSWLTKKGRYDEWEFTYDPMTDIAFMQNNVVVNQPSVGSLVGNGSGPDGTGPVANPTSSPQEISNPPNR